MPVEVPGAVAPESGCARIKIKEDSEGAREEGVFPYAVPSVCVATPVIVPA